MIQLYKKRIFQDAIAVNIIANAALTQFHKLTLISCYFLMESTEFPEDESEESEEDFNFDTLKNSKKTKSK